MVGTGWLAWVEGDGACTAGSAEFAGGCAGVPKPRARISGMRTAARGVDMGAPCGGIDAGAMILRVGQPAARPDKFGELDDMEDGAAMGADVSAITGAAAAAVHDPLHIWVGNQDAEQARAWADAHLAAAQRQIDALLPVAGKRTVENTLRPFDEARS